MNQKPLEALKAEGDMAFWRERHPRCPHCGHECDLGKNDWWGLCTEEGDVHEKDCPNCDLPFKIRPKVSFTFSTDEQGED